MSAISPKSVFVHYPTGLVTTSIFLPGLALVFMVGYFLFPTTLVFYAPAFGIGAAIVAWLLVSALVFRAAAKPDYGIPTSYAELLRHIQSAEAQLGTLPSPPPNATAHADATAQMAALKDLLKAEGLQWAIGYGYTNAWTRMHRVEEALIELQPLDDVLEGASYDELRLDGSAVPNRDDLLGKIRKAVEDLQPQATKYLKTYSVRAATASGPTITSDSLPDGTVGTKYNQTLRATGGTPPYTWTSPQFPPVPANPNDLALSAAGILSGTPTTASATTVAITVKDATGNSATRQLALTIDPPGTVRPPNVVTSGSADIARAALRTVRQTINEYRDERWSGLIVERNRLLGTCALTALAFFTILAIAIVNNAEPGSIIAAIVFALIGAAVGLGKRLRDESQADSAPIDEGLSVARLLTTPVFSGYCAVCGVVLMAMLPFATAVLEKSPTPPSVNLGSVFSIGDNPMGLFFAAIFGLTPGLLFERLQQQADKLKNDLQTSKATGPGAQHT